MTKIRVVGLIAVAALGATTVFASVPGKSFQWSTRSAEAKTLLGELQTRIESFQAGPTNVEMAKKIVAADPSFAMGEYYLSAVAATPEEAQAHYDKARALAGKASAGERRFIEAMRHVRVNQGADFAKSIPELEALAQDYPGERLIFVILGQLYNGDGKGEGALGAFQKAKALGGSPRVDAFLANNDLLHGRYAEARAALESVEKRLPKGSVPFPVRFGITFSHLYEGHPDEAIASLETYLREYRANGLDQQFPEVFIWNAIARIRLENGRLEEAMKAYQKGYDSVPGSTLPEEQKQTWLGRLHHGTCRVLARMGKHAEAWAEAEKVKAMIVAGGEPGRQYWHAYHYLAGYAKLEAGEHQAALEHLLQANPDDPFQTLLLGRAYEKTGRTDEARKAYRKVVESQWPGIERPLAFPEASRKLAQGRSGL